MNLPTCFRVTALGAAFFSLIAPASAHQLWIGANQYVLKYPGTRPGPVATTVFTTFGHRLPIDATLDDARFGGVYLHADGAAPVKVATTADGYRSAELKFEKTGAYWVASANKPIFSTQLKDANGVVAYQRVAKNEVSPGANVVDSTRIFGFAKTLIYVDGADAGDAVLGKALGHTLEIVPLENPAKAAKGDTLTVQVYFNGKTYAGEPIEVTADWEGAAATGTPIWSGETNSKGQVEIPLNQAGIWQLVATVIEPATGELAQKTNQTRYRASLTFEVPGSKIRM
jgi:uncharacterized GH25 family protein